MKKEKINNVSDLDELLSKPENIIQEKTELGEVMSNLDADIIDPSTRMTSLDMNTRLSGEQISAIVVFDEMQRRGLFGTNCNISRQLKRLNVSKDGQSRQEKVAIVQGQRESNGASTFGSRFMNLFKKQD